MKCLRIFLLGTLLFPPAAAQRVGAPTDDLTKLGVDDLFRVEVTSVGRKAQQMSKSPASVYVLTAEDIRRSGAASIPEALRWVPGMNVLSLDGRSWVVSIRGSAHLYSDKILVMIDGRSLYTPLFSGVIWDAIDLPMGDIERIEVVRGPGAVMWGPNAVNGVINIITRKTRQTRGGEVTAAVGNQTRGALGARWGGASGDRFAYRVWGKSEYRTSAYDSPGLYQFGNVFIRSPRVSNLDMATGRIGFRIDAQNSDESQWMVQGDLYSLGRHDPLGYPAVLPALDLQDAHASIRGGYLQARWTHTNSSGSEDTAQLSYSRDFVGYPYTGGYVQNLTADFQRRIQTGENNELYWGAGFQRYSDDTYSRKFAGFNPQAAAIPSGYVVLRDEWQAIPGRLTASAGIRLDYDSYHDLEYQPSLRLLFTPSARQSWWAAISRATRTPARFDRDLQFTSGSVVMNGFPVKLSTSGSPNMLSEVARWAETGYRFQSGQRWSIDTSVYLAKYSRLRSVDYSTQPQVTVGPTGISFLLPMHMSNSGAGKSFGGEVSATVQAARSWRLIPAYWYDRDERWLPASTAAYAYKWDRNPADVRHQATLRSQHDLSRHWQLDLMARSRSRDARLSLPGTLQFDARLGWRPGHGTEISLTAHNLADHRVYETVPEGLTPAIPIRRTLLLQWVQRF